MKKLFFLLPLVALLAAFRMPEAPVTVPATAASDPTIPADIEALLSKYGCVACHSIQRKLVGPKWTDIAEKKYSKKKIIALVKEPKPENWPGYPPMTAQKTVPAGDLGKIADWLVKLGQQK